jgi:hypothetical protein
MFQYGAMNWRPTVQVDTRLVVGVVAFSTAMFEPEQ